MAYGYGKKGTREGGVYHTAPVYREMKVEGNKALLYFDYDPTIDDKRAGKWYKRLPLSHRAREYRGFVIAGEDRRFCPARVKVRSVKDGQDIRGECLEAWSDFVERPAAVRYAWENQPNANAYGLHALPVAPFRTDDWPFIRALPKWADEWYAGTIPTNAASVFALTAIEFAPDCVISWLSASGKVYSLWTSSNSPVPDTRIQSFIPATPPINTVTTSQGEAQSMFYRLAIAR